MLKNNAQLFSKSLSRQLSVYLVRERRPLISKATSFNLHENEPLLALQYFLKFGR